MRKHHFTANTPALKKFFSQYIFQFLIVAGMSFGASDDLSYSNSNHIWSDAEGYYMYLPALFIYNGFDDLQVRTNNQFQKLPETGLFYTKYTYGIAILQAPFFLVGHFFISNFTDLPTDGLSLHYSKIISVAAFTYATVGMLFLFAFLRFFHNGFISFLVIAGLYTGTNALYYTFFGPGMSHIYSFALFSILLYLIHRFKGNYNFLNLAIMIFLLMLVVIIRPTNALFILFILFYHKFSFRSFWSKVKALGPMLIPTLVFVIILGILIFLPQVILWQNMKGSEVYYSYQGEGFIYWKAPKIGRVLFDVENGLFLYSPILLFSIFGLFRNLRARHNILTILLISVMTYIFASWWCWSFGGAYGHRCYVEWLPLLAQPLAGTVSWFIHMRNKALKILFTLIYLTCIYYSISLTFKYLWPWDGPDWTWKKYGIIVKETFLFDFTKRSANSDFQELKESVRQ